DPRGVAVSPLNLDCVVSNQSGARSRSLTIKVSRQDVKARTDVGRIGLRLPACGARVFPPQIGKRIPALLSLSPANRQGALALKVNVERTDRISGKALAQSRINLHVVHCVGAPAWQPLKAIERSRRTPAL